MEIKITDENFSQEVLQESSLVLVDFYADWCGPCKMMAPIIEELAAEYQGEVKIGKLNVDDSPEASQKYRVMSIPTIILFKNGQPIETMVGAVPKGSLIEKIEAHK